MIFECIMEKEKWEGKINRFVNYGNHYEIFIESRSSILILFGKTSSGNGFACMPDFQVGCHLINLKDKFWNTEKLIAVLGRVDGITASTALYHLSKKYPNLI